MGIFGGRGGADPHAGEGGGVDCTRAVTDVCGDGCARDRTLSVTATRDEASPPPSSRIVRLLDSTSRTRCCSMNSWKTYAVTLKTLKEADA